MAFGLEIPTYGWRATLAGVDMHTYAWSTLNLTEFRGYAVRSDNTILGQRQGRRGNRTYRDQLRVSLDILFVGAVDPDGIQVEPTKHAQFEANIAEFRSTVVEAAQDARGCIAGEFTDSKGDDWVADVQVVGWLPPMGLIEGIATLSLIVPDGALSPA